MGHPFYQRSSLGEVPLGFPKGSPKGTPGLSTACCFGKVGIWHRFLLRFKHERLLAHLYMIGLNRQLWVQWSTLGEQQSFLMMFAVFPKLLSCLEHRLTYLVSVTCYCSASLTNVPFAGGPCWLLKQRQCWLHVRSKSLLTLIAGPATWDDNPPTCYRSPVVVVTSPCSALCENLAFWWPVSRMTRRLDTAAKKRRTCEACGNSNDPRWWALVTIRGS